MYYPLLILNEGVVSENEKEGNIMQGSNVPQETVQTAQLLANLFLSRENRIIDAITTGAGWEIWLQVEFILWTRETIGQYNWSAAREVPYPNSNEKLDFALQRGNKYYGLELKAESANQWQGGIASSTFWTGMQADVKKLYGYSAKSGKSTSYGGGFAIGVVFHPKIKALGLREQTQNNTLKASLGAQQVLYAEGEQIGVIIAIQE